MTTLQFMVASPVEANQVLNGLYKEVVKPHTAKGAAGVISWQTHNVYLREKHRGAFHGPVLKAIAEQLWFTDEKTGARFRYSRAFWKRWLKEEFLTPKVQEYVVKKTGEVKYRLLPLSTEALSDDEYNVFLLEVQAFGTHWGVVFEEE